MMIKYMKYFGMAVAAIVSIFFLLPGAIGLSIFAGTTVLEYVYEILPAEIAGVGVIVFLIVVVSAIIAAVAMRCDGPYRDPLDYLAEAKRKEKEKEERNSHPLNF